VGLDESSSDWVLFLDDDIIPDSQLLHAYVDAMSKYGAKYDGFVGVTVLPEEPYMYPTAVHLSGVSFFWIVLGGLQQIY
jgi:GT2 family glycosyltransferase